jgi:excinuclease ABC subunit B
MAYNEKHGIKPETVRKNITDFILQTRAGGPGPVPQKPSRRKRRGDETVELPLDELKRLIMVLDEEMKDAARDLRFEYAARLRDEVNELKRELREAGV